MKRRRLVLTAGFARSPHVVLLAELLRRDRHEVVEIIVVSPFDVGRVLALHQRGGGAALRSSALRLVRGRTGARDALDELARREHVELRSLQAWGTDAGVPVRSVKNLNAAATVAAVRSSECDGMIYGGGGILRSPLIRAARGMVLNAHQGPLPGIRGMNACEWSVLLDRPITVTVHRIDEGIDTGPVLERIPVKPLAGDTLEDLRGRCLAAGVLGLRRAAGRDDLRGESQVGTSIERQCFVMAPALREIAERRLAASS